MREQSIFIEALEKSDPAERAAFLEEACAGDPALRPRIERLLERHRQTGDVFDAPSPWALATNDQPFAEIPGTVIGPYKLMEQIGEGGMGIVHVAEQTRPVRRKVALKIIKPGMDTKQVIARFEAERQALAMMDHPNIAKVHDGGTTSPPSEGGGGGGGRPYFVMELVRGIPITEYCDCEKLSIPERLELFVQVCRAVQHAHQKGIIHRDLKPSNILVTIIDGAAVPKVIDFGVAKATGASLTDRTLYTAFHQFVGTPLYMSPEQADLSGMDVDTRSDIYSLGVLLYELLTGTTPFDQDTFRTAAFDEMRRILREQEPPTPSTRLSSLGATRATVSANRKAEARQLDRTVRGELDWIVMKALEKDRKRRYETANDFAADVTRYLSDQPVEAGPPSAVYRLRKFLRRNKGPVSAGLTLAALLILGTLGTSIGLVRALQAERRATLAAERAKTAESLAKERLVEVSSEKERATTAEAKAKEEGAIAEAVASFLQKDLLAQADPEQNARDKKVSVEELLGRASARIEGKFAMQPLVEAKIRQTIGNAYRALSNYAAAGPHLERAWALYRGARGEEDLDALSALSNLAELYVDLDRESEAERMFQKVLDVRRRVLGKENSESLDALLNLASAYRGQLKYSDAELRVKEALEISRAQGEENPQTLHAMNDLAVLYSDQGHYDEAIPILEKVLEVQRRVHGENHLNTLAAMSNLGGVYAIRGPKLKAVEFLAGAMEISGRVLGKDHKVTLLRMSALARACWYSGQLNRSVALYEEVIPRLKTHLGADHFFASRAMSDLGWVYKEVGRMLDAIAVLEQAWDADRRRLGPQADASELTPVMLADAYLQVGLYDKSVTLYREAVAAARKQGEPRLPYTSHLLELLGRSLLKQRKDAEAESQLRESQLIRERIRPGNWATYNTRSLLGESLMCQKKFAEAEPLILSSYEGLKRLDEGKSPISLARVREAAERVVQLYSAWDRPQQAALWRARVGLSDLPGEVFARP